MTLHHLRSCSRRSGRHISYFDALIYTLVLIYFVHVRIACYRLSKAFWRSLAFFMGRHDTDMCKPNPRLPCHVVKRWHWLLERMSWDQGELGTHSPGNEWASVSLRSVIVRTLMVGSARDLQPRWVEHEECAHTVVSGATAQHSTQHSTARHGITPHLCFSFVDVNV